MRKIVIFLSLFIICSCTEHKKQKETVLVDDGLKYCYFTVNKSKYNIKSNFRLFYIQFDPKKYYIDLLLARDYQCQFLETSEYSKRSQAILAINASFFDKKFHTLGLQIQSGKLIKKVRNKFDGIFYVKNKNPNIVHPKQFKYERDISFAVQSRPRLVHEGLPILSLKKQIAKRSFIGITRDDQIVVGITENSIAYADDLAYILSLDEDSGGVNCKQALNLDGGTSSQLSFKYKGFHKEISGNSAVPNALGVFKLNN